MRELTSSELRVLANELKPKIEGSFLKKFYDLGDESFRFGFYKEGTNTVVYCRLLATFNETKFAEAGEQATQFAIAMRKRIEGVKVSRFYQHGADRIIVLELQGKGIEYKLVIEMFGKGNVILVRNDGIAELAYKIVSYKDRIVKPRASYSLPKSSSAEIEGLSKHEAFRLLEEIATSKGKLISELSKKMNIGPLYLEDLILGAGLDPRKELTKGKGFEMLEEGLVLFSKNLENAKPVLYTRDGAFVDYAIAPIKKYEELEKQEYASLSELLDSIYSEGRFEVKDDRKEKALEELDANIDRQRQLAEQTKAEVVNYAAAAHRIFENMDAINALITYLRENKHATVDQAKQEFTGIKIKEIDLKNKVAKIEV